jgi:hypothetical protein
VPVQHQDYAAESIDHCLATHRFLHIEGPILLSHPFYELPEEAFRRAAQPEQVDSKIRQIYSRAVSPRRAHIDHWIGPEV